MEGTISVLQHFSHSETTKPMETEVDTREHNKDQKVTATPNKKKKTLTKKKSIKCYHNIQNWSNWNHTESTGGFEAHLQIRPKRTAPEHYPRYTCMRDGTAMPPGCTVAQSDIHLIQSLHSLHQSIIKRYSTRVKVTRLSSRFFCPTNQWNLPIQLDPYRIQLTPPQKQCIATTWKQYVIKASCKTIS